MELNEIEKNENIVELVSDCNHHILALWAADCVEHVIKYYTVYFPKDDRVHNAIKAARGFAKGQVSVLEARRVSSEAHKAAREAEGNNAAQAVAKAAGSAAATAHIEVSAMHAATHAVKAKAYSSGHEIEVIKKEQNWQCNRLSELRELHNQDKRAKKGLNSL